MTIHVIYFYFYILRGSMNTPIDFKTICVLGSWQEYNRGRNKRRIHILIHIVIYLQYTKICVIIERDKEY